ncbi:ATP-binding cassette domain-containing protein [Haloechinothrix sp. LS1_15]|uniref:ATP-binding cassette domain-containing protein n=1 Tax=Haloechinothrix sp. LS1_15 TaxID=2652248 RepID=UPI00294842F1|nr:ATP-binding cassette domain-containing protein [Haloechinothrix sp. LS1_15]MDV6011608.1 ATP-binding cassette domain-containing protein [Haloechinothrix sp. LS1_15]
MSAITRADLAITASGLVKVFGNTRAVDGVDLAVPMGGVYGVLGPNGAGKTTTIRMLATLLRPDAGEARVFGHDVLREPDTVRGRVSLTGQFASIDEDLTGSENLVLLGRLLGHRKVAARDRAAELLAAFDLAEAAGRQVKHYSGGMRRRLDIAASIVVTPDLLFLDEPTTGLDPRSRSQVWDIVRTLVDAGTTVLLTTQYLEEADQLADRIAVIDHGSVIAEGTPDKLKAKVGSGTVQVRLADATQRDHAARVLGAVLGSAPHLEGDPAVLTASIDSDRTGAADAATGALSRLASAGIDVSAFALGRPSLDEVFLTLTGQQAGQDNGAGHGTATGEEAAA